MKQVDHGSTTAQWAKDVQAVVEPSTNVPQAILQRIKKGEEEEVDVFADLHQQIDYANVIVPSRVKDTSFKVDANIYNMLKTEKMLWNSTDDELHQHLKNFLEVYAMHNIHTKDI